MDKLYILTALLIFGLSLLVMICLLFILIYKIMISKVKTIHPFYRGTIMICILTCISSTIIDSIRVESCYFDTLCDINDTNIALKMAADGLFFFTTIIFYIILIGRCYLTFRDTEFELKKCTIIFISIMIIISVLCMISYLIILQFSLYSNILIKYIDAGMTILMSVNDIILNITLLIIFIHKLRSLIVNLGKNDVTIRDIEHDESELITNDDAVSSILLDNAQVNLIIVITRHTLLSFYALIFNQIVYLILCSLIFIPIYSDTIQYLSLICYMFRSLDNVVIVSALYLNFGFNLKIYLKLCGYCHVKFYRRITIKTKNKIKHERSFIQNSLHSMDSRDYSLFPSKTEPSNTMISNSNKI